MERIVHKARSFEEADRWDVEQQVSMSAEERLRAARILKDRAFPSDAKDVRACHRPDSTASSRASARPAARRT